MKNIFKKSIIAVIFTCLLVGCDLEIQPDFEYDADIDLSNPFENITAWQWIQTRTGLNDEGEISGEEFHYLIEAIKLTGMETEFNSETPDRTYLLLNNNAFTGGGDIIQLVTGSSAVGEGETPAQTLADADVDKLRNVLKYHIVPDFFIDQVNALPNFDVDYSFQSLLPSADGEITFRRDSRRRIRINNDPNLPSTRANENVRRHNYVFSNGIGHIIQDYCRKVPF